MLNYTQDRNETISDGGAKMETVLGESNRMEEPETNQVPFYVEKGYSPRIIWLIEKGLDERQVFRMLAAAVASAG